MKSGIVATGARPTPAVHHFLPQTPDLESASTATTTTPRETPPSQTPKQPRVIRRVKIVKKKQPVAAETTTAGSAVTTSEQQQQPHTTTTTMVKKQRRASTGKMSTSAAAAEQSPRVLVKKVVTTTTRRYSLPKSAISSSSECSHEESNTVRKPGKKKAQRRVSFAMDSSSSSKENNHKNGGAGPEFSTPPTSPDNSESSEASEFSLTVDEIPVSVVSKEDGRLILSPKRATQKGDATPPVSPSRKKKKSVSSSLDAPHSPSRKSKKSSSSSSDGPSSPSKSPSKSKKKSVSASLSSCPESPSKSKKSKSSSKSKKSGGSESPRKDSSSSSPRKSAIDKKAVKHFLPHPPIADNSKTTPSVKHFLPPPPVAGAEEEDKKKRNFNRWAPIPTFSNGSLLEDDNDVREAYKMHRKWMADDASLCNKPVFNSVLSPSAIRIQAAVRAHLQRKQYLSQRKWAQVQQRYTLMTEAATQIQAHTRGYLVWNYMRVPLLQHKLKRIEEAHERELQDIQRNKWSKMKAMRQQAMAEHNLDATTELECIHEAWSDTKAEIHKMRKENEILRQENDKLSQATRIFAAKNHKLIINLEKTKHMTAQLEANLPELEKESQRFVQVEAQFRERWMQYRTAMQEGGELLQMEQVVSSKYWQSICDICQKVRHNARHVQPKNHDLAVEVQAIVKQETQRNALLPNVPSSENAPVSGSVFDEEDETEGTSSSSGSDSDDNNNSKRQRRRVSFAP